MIRLGGCVSTRILWVTKMARHLQRLQPSFMPRKVRSTLQIMISFIFILMSTRTEPYRNSILAEKKKKKKQKPKENKTKNLENRFRFDCCTGSSGPLLVPRSAILSASATDPSVVLDKRIGPGRWPVHRLPSPFRKYRGGTPIFSEGRRASVHS